MGTNIRPEISKRSQYWISRHRHYELKYFCLQYPSWKKHHASLNDISIRTSTIERTPSNGLPSDPTANLALLRDEYASKIRMVEKAAWKADPQLCSYILRAVTEGLSYTQLKSRLNIPCSRDTYYDRYRRFFWLLSNSRN